MKQIEYFSGPPALQIVLAGILEPGITAANMQWTNESPDPVCGGGSCSPGLSRV